MRLIHKPLVVAALLVAGVVGTAGAASAAPAGSAGATGSPTDVVNGLLGGVLNGGLLSGH